MADTTFEANESYTRFETIEDSNSSDVVANHQINRADFTSENCQPMRQAEDSPDKKPRSRHRQRNPENQIKNKNRRRRNSGQPYQSSNGTYIPPRAIGSACTCLNQCRTHLFGKEMELFHCFWDLGSYDKQNVYLASRIQVDEVKQHYLGKKKDSTKSSKRNFCYRYSVNIMGKQIHICKVEFLAIHGLQFSRKRVEILSRKIRDGLLIPGSDGRGRHDHHNKYDEMTLNMVRQHIIIVPKYASHYSRQVNPNRVYLDCDMTISCLYGKYVEWIDRKNKDLLKQISDSCSQSTSIEVLEFVTVSEDKYRRIFCDEFNIGFKLPRSDTYKTCDAIHIKLNANKNNPVVVGKLKRKLELHQNEAQAMLDDLDEMTKLAKTSRNIDVFSFDLQQALVTPNLTVGEAFYLRKLMTYNFGIHEARTERGFMFMWPENVAKRGSDEMASCIWKYFQINKPSSDHLVVYSDNCGGQGKNWNMMSLWQQLVSDGVYKSVEHRFLVPGHTRMSCDRDFALVENRKKRVQQMYSPDDWHQLVKDSNKKNPFVVTVMNNEDFFTFERLLAGITKKNITNDKKPLNFRKVRSFLFETECSDDMSIKHSINSQFEPVTIKKLGSPSLKLKDMISKKYDGCLILTRKKIDDIRKLMDYLPPIKRKFYSEIFSHVGIKGGVSDDVELL